jgi:Flp pilus assembly pilin Flp
MSLGLLPICGARLMIGRGNSIKDQIRTAFAAIPEELAAMREPSGW